jgi:DTW domain-containing protein YfiP
MIPTSGGRRQLCHHCLRPQRSCICQWITPVEHQAEVVILQHPLETGNAKGSARLLHLSLPRSNMVAGECFDAAELKALLMARSATGAAGMHAVLLYPELPHAGDLVAVPPPLDPALLEDPAQVRLIVLDATWRKSRKMLYLNPLLQALPRLALDAVPPSQYRIRKAHLPHQLSTLEATCHALARLERNAARYEPLLRAFDGFVEQQAACFRPASGD